LDYTFRFLGVNSQRLHYAVAGTVQPGDLAKGTVLQAVQKKTILLHPGIQVHGPHHFIVI
jgi:hypothetical protein